MSEYTPTTEEVRSIFNEGAHDSGEFDRWLREEKAKAWDEAVDAAADYYYQWGSHGVENPYRKP